MYYVNVFFIQYKKTSKSSSFPFVTKFDIASTFIRHNHLSFSLPVVTLRIA